MTRTEPLDPERERRYHADKAAALAENRPTSIGYDGVTDEVDWTLLAPRTPAPEHHAEGGPGVHPRDTEPVYAPTPYDRPAGGAA